MYLNLSVQSLDSLNTSFSLKVSHFFTLFQPYPYSIFGGKLCVFSACIRMFILTATLYAILFGSARNTQCTVGKTCLTHTINFWHVKSNTWTARQYLTAYVIDRVGGWDNCTAEVQSRPWGSP